METLQSGAHSNTNQELYDRFVRLIRNDKRILDWECTQAAMLIFHPVEPNSDLLLALLRKRCSQKSGADLRAALPHCPADIFLRRTWRTHALLQQQSRASDITWIVGLCKRRELMIKEPHHHNAEIQRLRRHHEDGLARLEAGQRQVRHIHPR